MSRFNNEKTPRIGPRSAITSIGTGTTAEGGAGFTRGAKGELFLLAASFMGGDDNFYEKSDGRYDRLLGLIGQPEVYGDGEWLYQLVKWLRTEANMRTVSMVIALEAVHTRVKHEETNPFSIETGPQTYSGGYTNRDIVDVALNRADEPAEAIAYWTAKHGKPLPQPIKNGIGDAARRLYNEYSYLKYGNSKSAVVKMIDVLRMTHPKPKDDKQAALFSLITGQSDIVGPESLPMVYWRKKLYDMPRDASRESVTAEHFKQAGMTWENISEFMPGGMDAYAWETAIPNMGIMALIRNLRNFDQAGIGKESVSLVQSLISNPDVVRKSRQLPFRWYNAYRATDSLHYASALEEALDLSLENVPELDGPSLILIDMSGSMFEGKVSERSNVLYADAASLFGAALKLRNPDSDLFQYGSEFPGSFYMDHKGRRFSDYSPSERWTGVTKKVDIGKGASLLRAMSKFHDMGGTRTHQAVAETILSKHKRVILLTDEQSWTTSYDRLPVPANVPVYVWNLAGYRVGTMPSGSYNRHVFGGLSDSAFKLIPILESGSNAGWPWEVRESAGVS